MRWGVGRRYHRLFAPNGVTLIVEQTEAIRVTIVDTVSGGHIRRAVRADLLAVVRIERAVFDEPWGLSAFEQFLGAPGFLVIDDSPTGALGDDVAGYIVATTIDAGERQIGHIKDFAVKPALQGEGRGRALLERALAVLDRQGVSIVRLEVRPSNERAIDLYRRNGFRFRRRLAGYYPDGEDALVLVRPLGDRDRF